MLKLFSTFAALALLAVAAPAMACDDDHNCPGGGGSCPGNGGHVALAECDDDDHNCPGGGGHGGHFAIACDGNGGTCPGNGGHGGNGGC